MEKENEVVMTAEQIAQKTRASVGESSLSVSSLATIYGCCGLFDPCGDADLMSLSLEKVSPFMDWIGWSPTDVCKIVKNFITYQRAEAGAGGASTPGWLANPCADPYGTDWGKCDFTLKDFARLRRSSPVRDITKTALRMCVTSPRYRLDGQLITDDREYDILMATEVILQDLYKMIMDGNAGTAGQFDGLKRLVKTGYTDSDGHRCQLMDSIIVDWNDNDTDGGAGITWNGNAVPATFNLIDVLGAVYRRIRRRIGMAPALAGRRPTITDMALVLPTDFIPCILDAFTCWSVCPGSANTYEFMNTIEGRNYRQSLNGGAYGYGRIYLDGFEIPIIGWDWGTVVGPTRFDAWFLTGSWGGVKLLNGEFNDLNAAARVRPDWYTATDGGRLLMWSQSDHTCDQTIVEMQPRLLAWAPWAQARIENIRCNVAGGILSADPWDTSFFPETSFLGVACPSAEPARSPAA